MAGALSGHLVDAYTTNQRLNSPIVTRGAMSFDSRMHGTPQAGLSDSFSLFGSESAFMNEGLSDATTLKIASLQAKLNQKLGPEYISQRPGPGGGPKLTYAEGWKIINLANEVFGFNGWSSSVISLTMDFMDYNEDSKRYNVGVTAIMRVTLRDGVYHEDIGYGMLENSKSKGAALDKCKKEAVTDGLKRALRNFGNLLGNCLYDKSYTQEVIKIKVPPPKFEKSELHRRPEFEESKPNITAPFAPSSAAHSTMLPTRQTSTDNNTPTRPPQARGQTKPITSVPPHMRAEVRASTSGSSNITPNNEKISITSHQFNRSGMNISASNSNSPKPPQLAIERKVTFANPTPQGKPLTNISPNSSTRTPLAPKVEKVEDADDSFNFSDDDAFFAVVDLGDGDLGRPIGLDEGRPIEGDVDLGRPIDYHEGLSGEQAVLEQNVLEQKEPSKQVTLIPVKVSGPSCTRINAIAAGLDSSANNNSSGAESTGAGTKDLRQARASISTTNNRLWTNPPQLQKDMCRPPLQNLAQDQNSSLTHSADTSTPVMDTPAKRPTTASMGGFHFPPGVNSTSANRNAPNLKRSAETMGAQPHYRGSRPGMGLQSSSGVGGSTRREILGRLDLDSNNGDVKRIKR